MFDAAGTINVTHYGATAQGCDSTLTLTVNVNPVLHGDYETTICDNQLPYVFHGETFTEAGTVNVTHYGATAQGCDSTLTLTVNVNPVLHGDYETTICDNQLPYVFHGETFTEAGTVNVTHYGATAQGCDSTLTLTVNVNPVLHGDYETTICDNQLPYVFHGETFTAAGTINVTHYGATAQGCDSTLTLTVNVNPVLHGDYETTICDNQLPYVFHGETFTEAGTVNVTHYGATAQGCDSTLTLTVNVNPVLHGDYETTICDNQLPYVFHGETFTEAGTVNVTHYGATAQGCDSTLTLTVNVNPVLHGDYEITICDNQLPYVFHG